ncbi:MAG: dihydrofolate reductase [Candidatus Andersenbacteria bacterium]
MIAIIAALDANGVIGHNNSIPWDIPEERKLFRKLTTGNVVVMGRKTFESIGKPLPDRINIVVSRTVSSIPGTEVYPSLEQALEAAKSYQKDIFIIGGAQIYEQALEISEVDTMYLSYLHDSYSGDGDNNDLVSFPSFAKDTWELADTNPYQSFTLKIYKRVQAVNN